MCGRTACTLNKSHIARAFSTCSSSGQHVPMKWIDNINSGLEYIPSYNISPSRVLPVMVSNNHFVNTVDNSTDLVLCNMKWGLVPHWKKEEGNIPSDFKLSNCRAEGILSTSFRTPLMKGQRCVIVADGFYEWMTLKDSKQKQPYFIFFASDDKHRITTMKERNWNTETDDYISSWWNESLGWQGPKLLTMAGLFDVNRNSSQNDSLYTFSVITVAAHQSFSDIHHRMPAVLETNEEITNWLNYTDVPVNSALRLLRPTDSLDWYPVSSLVGNSRNNSPDCLTLATITPTPSKSSKSLSQAAKGTMPITNWLKQDPKSTEIKNEAAHLSKKIKLENKKI